MLANELTGEETDGGPVGEDGVEHEGEEPGSPEIPVSADPPPTDHHSSRRWFLGAGIVVVAGAAAGITYWETRSPTTISAGSGDATVSWTPATNAGNGQPPQPFSGIVDGLPVSGVSTTTIPGNDGAANPLVLPSPLMTWRGTLGRKPFDLAVSIMTGGSPPNAEAPDLVPGFTVKGTYGGQPVLGVVGQEISPFFTPGPLPIRFRGTVGSLRVSGTVVGPNGKGQRQTATASFVVAA